jgi:RES domain-containing protein
MGVSLFAGYDEGLQTQPLSALKNAEHSVLGSVRRRLQTENHFNLSSGIREMLRRLQSRIEMFSETNSFFRARIGVHERAVEWDTGAHAFIPYANELMLAPRPPLASAGRLNRAGVSYLYVATDAATAVAEVRPHPGHVVSTGTVQLTHVSRVADFSRVRLAEFSSSDAQLEDFEFLSTIERDFATPVVPEERSNYLLGQLVADVLRELGFDGVAYRSSVSTGINFCFFEPAHFTYVKGSGAAVRIRALEYRTEAERAIYELGEEYRKL